MMQNTGTQPHPRRWSAWSEVTADPHPAFRHQHLSCNRGITEWGTGSTVEPVELVDDDGGTHLGWLYDGELTNIEHDSMFWHVLPRPVAKMIGDGDGEVVRLRVDSF